jgi:hypothetical protein
MNRNLRVLQKKRQRILLVGRKSRLLRVDGAYSIQALSSQPKRKDDQRALCLGRREKLLIAISLQKKRSSLQYQSQADGLHGRWRFFYGCDLFSERTQAPDGNSAPSTNSPEPPATSQRPAPQPDSRLLPGLSPNRRRCHHRAVPQPAAVPLRQRA